MNICHYCQQTEINTCVKGGKLIKGLVKRYYSADRNICQGSLAKGEQSWQKALLKVFLFIILQFSHRIRALRRPGFILVCINRFKLSSFIRFFLIFFQKQAVNRFDFTLASFLQWSTNRCLLLSLTSPLLGRLLGAVPEKINCFWNAGELTASSHKQHTQRKNARPLNCNSSSSFGRERNIVYRLHYLIS